MTDHLRVTLLAATEIRLPALSLLEPTTTSPADHLAEVAGRACYESWDRPNPDTAANPDYLTHILDVGHYSVLSHASATFYVQGVSRTLTHELVRHRWLAFSQASQRYIDASVSSYVEPPAVTAVGGRAREILAEAHARAVGDYETLAATLTAEGLPRKQAREAARSVLPNATTTAVVVTGNHRAWRDFLHQRLSPAADKEIRGLAAELLRQLRDLAPATYADFPEQ